MANDVSPASEQRMRRVLGTSPRGSLTGSALSLAIRESAPVKISRQAVYMAISSAYRCGLLLRVGKFPCFRYSINPKWKRGAVRPKRARTRHTPPRATGTAVAYIGPAFGSAVLAPAIGPRPADPEVMPPEIAEMVDSLHQRLFRHAHGVVEA